MTGMAQVTVELPTLLTQVTGVPARVPVEAASRGEAMRVLVERHPALGVHLFDESGGFRQHVLCFHNGANTRWDAAGDEAVSDGDVLTIIQAVSGG